MSDEGVSFGVRFLMVGSGALLGGLGMALYFRNSDKSSSRESISERTRQYLLRTYQYTALEIFMLGSSAYLGHVAGLSQPLLQFYNDHPWISLAAGVIVPTGCLLTTFMISKKNAVAKHVALTASILSIGIPLCPLVTYVPTDVMTISLLTTGGVVGLLSAIAAVAPNTTFLKWGGPLLIGASLLSFVGLAPLLFRGQAVARFANNVSLFGGLVIFSGFLMYDTQVAIVRAENVKSEDELDPINESLSITLDILNIFIRILQVYLEEENRKRRRK